MKSLEDDTLHLTNNPSVSAFDVTVWNGGTIMNQNICFAPGYSYATSAPIS